jgi:acyl-CoA synthetase (AMP-forming)/AMP-acid ligase II
MFRRTRRCLAAHRRLCVAGLRREHRCVTVLHLGTTGNPKGCLYSHRSTVLHALASCMKDILALSSRECVLLIVPMFHANGWGVPYSAAMAGAKLVFPGAALDGQSVCELLRHEAMYAVDGRTDGVAGPAGAPGEASRESKPTHLRRGLIGGSAAARSLIARLRASCRWK